MCINNLLHYPLLLCLFWPSKEVTDFQDLEISFSKKINDLQTTKTCSFEYRAAVQHDLFLQYCSLNFLGCLLSLYTELGRFSTILNITIFVKAI